MSKFLLKDADGSYRKVMDDVNDCKYKINGICCNEKSKYYREFPFEKCKLFHRCRYFEEEDKK